MELRIPGPACRLAPIARTGRPDAAWVRLRDNNSRKSAFLMPSALDSPRALLVRRSTQRELEITHGASFVITI